MQHKHSLSLKSPLTHLGPLESLENFTQQINFVRTEWVEMKTKTAQYKNTAMMICNKKEPRIIFHEAQL